MPCVARLSRFELAIDSFACVRQGLPVDMPCGYQTNPAIICYREPLGFWPFCNKFALFKSGKGWVSTSRKDDEADAPDSWNEIRLANRKRPERIPRSASRLYVRSVV
jgi:hypothetical protein